MNVVNRVTWENLKENRKRTVVTIIGIIVSVAMFVAVAISVCSFMQLFQDVEIETGGRWHVYYDNVATDKIDTILKDERIESGYIRKVIDPEKGKEEAVTREQCKAGEVYKVYAFFKNLDDLKDNATDLGNKVNVDSENMDYHSSLLIYTGKTEDRGFNSMIRNIMIIMVIIIMLGSVSLIYNAFSISLSERGRYLGMLSSIGATKKQKRKSVFFEGVILGGIGIPLGVLAGFAGMWITFKAVNPIILDMLTTHQTLHIVVEPVYLALAVGCSVLTIVISAAIPARRASKITAIDAIRQTKDIKIKSKKVRTSKITQKIFGFEGALGLKNLKRNRKRYRITVFALATNVILFLAVSSFGFYFMNGYDSEQRDYNADAYAMGDNVSKPEVQKELMDIDGIEKADVEAYLDTNYRFFLGKDEANKHLTKKALDAIKNAGIPKDEVDGEVNITAMPQEDYEKYLEECGIKDDPSAKMRGVIINRNKIRKDYSVGDVQMYDYKTGDNITLQAKGEEKGGNALPTKQVQNIKILGMTDQCTMGLVHSENTSINFIVPMSTMDELKKQVDAKQLSYCVFMKCIDEQQAVVTEELNKMHDRYDLHVYNVYQQIKQIKQIGTLAGVFSFGFIGLITLICIANIMNTVSTSMQLRRREMAMLRSVGMTPKCLDKMLVFESMFYGLKALLFGLPISFGIMYVLYAELNSMIAMPFELPIKNILIAIFSVFLVVGLAMRYSVRKIKKENLIDALKAE